MIDQWNEVLRCPQCRNSGTASLSLSQHAETPTVEAVHGGFKVVQTEYGPNFRCGDCDVPALP